MHQENSSFFGSFGGRYVAEVLRKPLEELEAAFKEAVSSRDFMDRFRSYGTHYVGRPTPLLLAENITADLGGAAVYIKMEGLANTGAHKINNVLGQALLAERMGKKRIIAETGAGQHGLATAAACAKLGFECQVYMGEVDIRRQRPNVFWMEQLGTEVIPVKTGSKTLKDAVNQALRDWSESFPDTHYLLGSALGPAPYPDMVREFQSVIGKETAQQIKGIPEQVEELIACVGGGSNAIGFFAPFLEDKTPALIGVEAGGRGMSDGNHASRMTGYGKEGIVQGYKSMFLLNNEGQVMPTHSVSAGLDYPGIGPQLAHLGQSGRVRFTSATDKEAVDAMRYFARKEGVIFALESSHAAAEAIKRAPKLPRDKAIVINMSGRGDKDLFITAPHIDREKWKKFLMEEAANI